MQGIYQKHMHIFIQWRKHVQSLKQIDIWLYEDLCSWDTHCLYIKHENDVVHNVEKVKKKWSNNYIQTTCTSLDHKKNKKKKHAQFQNDRYKTVRGVFAHKRYPLFIYLGWKMTMFMV